MGACDFNAASPSTKKWELVGHSNNNQGEVRTAGGGLGWVMMSMAPRKDVALDPLMPENNDVVVALENIDEPLENQQSMMGLRISKYISTEYDELNFYSTQPIAKKREHILDQRPEIRITKEYSTQVERQKIAEPVDSVVEELEEVERQPEVAQKEIEASETQSIPQKALKKADKIFRKFAVSKK